MAKEQDLAKGMLAGEHKHKHEAHVRKLHSGFHVKKHHPDGSTTEHSAADLDEAMQHVQEHMQPAEAEGDAEGAAPEAATGSAQTAPPAE